MFRKKKKIRTQKEIVPYLYRQVKDSKDQRLQSIYIRYHEKKPITLDDLRYLWEKDPESCEKFVHSFIGDEKDEKRMETEQQAIIYIRHIEDELHETKSNLNQYHITQKSIQTMEDVMQSMENVKQMVTTMSQTELVDLMEHLNTATELRKNCEDELEGWKQFLNETTVFDPLTDEISVLDYKL